MKLFSLFDRKASSYGLPVFYPSSAEAIRSVTVAVNDSASKSAVALFSADFDLYELGDWDYSQGCITCEYAPAFLLNLGSLKEVSHG